MAATPQTPELPRLTDAELAFFASEGYVIKHGVMEPSACAKLRSQLWENNPTSTLVRGDPSTWVGPLPPEDAGDEGQGANAYGGFSWQLRRTGGEELTMNALPRRCFAIAEQLLGRGAAQWPTGGPFTARLSPGGRFVAKRGQNCRGTYVRLPRPASASRKALRDHAGIHFDSALSDDSNTVSRFLAVGLIDDTPPGCGGFTLYPRSAHRFYELALQLRREGVRASSEEGKGRLQALVRAVEADTEPVDCHGETGTVVLMHRAMAHKVAENYSARLRQALLYDFDCAEGASWRGELVCGHEIRAPITDQSGAVIPPRQFDDEFWAAQPPLRTMDDGAVPPGMWEMWGAALQHAASSPAPGHEAGLPSREDAPVATAEDFVARWDSRRNFRFGAQCPPIAAMQRFEFPPTEAIIDAMLALDSTVAIPARRRHQSEYADKDHNHLEAFRAMPRAELQASSFNLRSQDFTALDCPGGVLAGFEDAVLQPWRTFLWDNDFTWDRCYPILRVSSADSVTGYHCDQSNVLFWQVRGCKTFHGCQDPDRWVGPPQHPKPAHTPMSASLREPEDALSLRVGHGDFVWNHLLTPHWVDSHSLSLNINLSIGGLRHTGRLCAYEQSLYASKEPSWRNSMGFELTSSAALQAQARL